MARLYHPLRNPSHKKLSRLLYGYRGDGKRKRSMDALANALDVSTETVRKYLNHPQLAPLEKIIKLADALDVPLEEFRNSIHYSNK